MMERARTMNSNYFVRMETTPSHGGCDLTISALRGLTFEDGSTSMNLHLRKEHGPRIGERVMVNGVLVKVLDKRYGDNGSLLLLDEDTKAWHKWN